MLSPSLGLYRTPAGLPAQRIRDFGIRLALGAAIAPAWRVRAEIPVASAERVESLALQRFMPRVRLSAASSIIVVLVGELSHKF